MAGTCSICDGVGWATCEMCLGVGTTLQGGWCGDCQGNGYTPCRRCEGAGELRDERETCIYCSGRGWDTCPRCDGKGGWDKPGQSRIYCSECNTNGTVTCSECGGKGVRVRKVPTWPKQPRPAKASVEARAAEIQEKARIAKENELREHERRKKATELAAERVREWEALTTQRRDQGLCEECGEKLGWVARWRGQTQCKECQ